MLYIELVKCSGKAVVVGATVGGHALNIRNYQRNVFAYCMYGHKKIAHYVNFWLHFNVEF